MSKVFASITTSVDGYVTGPDDGPGQGLGKGGERLHYWVFGGPWSYDEEPTGKPGQVVQEWFDSVVERMGAAVAGRNMYEAAGHWGDTNPWGVPCFIVTHRTQEQPAGDDFVFVDGLAEAIERAKQAAGNKDVSLGGGADVIRQGLELGLVDELSIVIAPVILGSGKRLFEGFTQDIELEHQGVRQSQYATIIDYAVTRP